MTAYRIRFAGFLVRKVKRFAILIVGLFAAGTSQADVFNLPSGQTSLQFVFVGNAGNLNDPTSGGLYGGVPYTYNVGKFNVTVAQYVMFLNAVAATDTYGLYNPNMATRANIAGIARTGSSGSYSYSIIGSPNQPIAYVSWGDAARFANWLTNGQPTQAEWPDGTETGSYTLSGATSDAALNSITRNATAKYVIPTENEWYKAAYYDPSKGGSDYWLYPMRLPIRSRTVCRHLASALQTSRRPATSSRTIRRSIRLIMDTRLPAPATSPHRII